MPTLTTLAFDYDGTLTQTGLLAAPVRQALRRVSAAGLKLVLVTGRTLSELQRVCPDCFELFDVLVVENGAILAERGGLLLPLARPVDRALARALEDGCGLLVHEGQVLIATEARAEAVVREQIARLGLEVRLFRNRGSLMVLPPTVSKSSGLSHALARLGATPAETAAFGDAENDRELLELAALGIAVGDAVDELKAVADLVLDQPNGLGVVDYLERVVLAG